MDKVFKSALTFAALMLVLGLVQCTIKIEEEIFPPDIIAQKFEGLEELPKLNLDGFKPQSPEMPFIVRESSAFEVFEKEAGKDHDDNDFSNSSLALKAFISKHFPELEMEVLEVSQQLDLGILEMILQGSASTGKLTGEVLSDVYMHEQYRGFFPRVMVPDTSAISSINARVMVFPSLDVRASGTSGNVNPGTGNTGNGKCADEAKAALANVIKKLEEKKDQQISAIDEAYLSWLEEIEQTLELRDMMAEAELSQRLQNAQKEGEEYLKLAAALAENFPQLAQEVRIFALLNAHAWQQAAQLAHGLSKSINQSANRSDQAKALAKKEDLHETVMENFHQALENAIKVLERVLANCHNQGSGN